MPRFSEIWRNQPLFRLILEEVLNHTSGVSEKDLLETLKKEHGVDVSRSEFYEELMKLELRGFIVVTRVGRDLIIKVSPNIIKILS